MSRKNRVRHGWQKRHVSGSGFGWHGESWRAPSSQYSKQSAIVCYTCVQCVRETRVCSKESLRAIVFLVSKVKFKIESSKGETVWGFRSMSYLMPLNVTYFDYDYYMLLSLILFYSLSIRVFMGVAKCDPCSHSVYITHFT